ncbi:hypothetical protein [[Phormidium ambiguum] IAM M-71]|uniref:hypothetical protein n=1 Tax=[Phormidium ambiguum] IAM M-71 TaxID=454136 RepID=UPI0011614A0B|nr:hypothetical protein [Phormidium ambiguum]
MLWFTDDFTHHPTRGGHNIEQATNFCFWLHKSILRKAEGRRKGRRQKAEGRRKKVEGRRKKVEGRRQKERQKAEGRRQKERQKAEGKNSPCPLVPLSPLPPCPTIKEKV